MMANEYRPLEVAEIVSLESKVNSKNSGATFESRKIKGKKKVI